MGDVTKKAARPPPWRVNDDGTYGQGDTEMQIMGFLAQLHPNGFNPVLQCVALFCTVLLCFELC